MRVSLSRCALTSTLTAVMALASTGVAQAVAPDNDDFDSATAVATVPFAHASSTVEATAGDDDPLSQCNGMGNSIWYAFTAPADMYVRADTFGSNFDTVLDVYTGQRGSLEWIACNDDSQGTHSSVAFQASAGRTYYVLVRSFNGVSGGDVTFNLQEAAPPPPALTSVVVDPHQGTVTRQGQVTVTGTVTCNSDAWAGVSVNGVQANRRFRAEGGGVTGVPCSTTPSTWSITFTSGTGVNFVTGEMTANIYSEAYGSGGFASASGSEVIRLTSVRPR